MRPSSQSNDSLIFRFRTLLEATAGCFLSCRRALTRPRLMLLGLLLVGLILSTLLLTGDVIMNLTEPLQLEARDLDDGRLLRENSPEGRIIIRSRKQRASSATTPLPTKDGRDFRNATNTVLKEAWNGVEQQRRVHFLSHEQLAHNDAFSASWMQRRADFMTIDLHKIDTCEDAAFVAFEYAQQNLPHTINREPLLRMTADWLDFSVEHLSKWWKMLMIYDQEIPYQTTVTKLQNYINREPSYNPHVANEPVLKHGIAVIAFRAYTHRSAPGKAATVTTLSLAATIESLRRAGFGRVVVVGMEDSDLGLIKASFEYLAGRLQTTQQKQQSSGPLESSKQPITQLGHMEVSFVQGSKVHSKTSSLKANVPRAALLGLKEAFSIADMVHTERSVAQQQYKSDWLGNRSDDFWQYVYLTEPDSILQTRPTTLRQLKAQVDQGHVLVPHRLQPIPHESDVRGAPQRWSYLPEAAEFKEVLELDSLEDTGNKADVCCDEYKGPDWKPGRAPSLPNKCNNFWYMCDFHPNKEAASVGNGTTSVDGKYELHKQLKPYQLIRLVQGTGIVHLTSQEHGRRCMPGKKAGAIEDTCQPPKKEFVTVEYTDKNGIKRKVTKRVRKRKPV